MITAWRARWAAAIGAPPSAPPIPFLFVQLSAWFGNWGFDDMPCVANYCPVITRIRLAQARDSSRRAAATEACCCDCPPPLRLAAQMRARSFDRLIRQLLLCARALFVRARACAGGRRRSRKRVARERASAGRHGGRA